MTENEAVFNILEKVKPYLNDDTELDPRTVAFDLANQRALFLRNEYNKNRSIDEDTIQDLGCVTMEPADPAECCVTTTGCKVMRTVLTLPTPIELYNDNGFTTVGPDNKTQKAFSKTTFTGSKFVGNGKYTSNEIFYYYANNRIYLVSNNDNHKFIDTINIRGIFENPEGVAPFINCDTGI